MRYITQGMVNPDKFNIFVYFARFESKSVIDALRDYAVVGHPQSVAADINGVKRPNFNRDLEKLNKVAAKVERCKEIDLAGKHD